MKSLWRWQRDDFCSHGEPTETTKDIRITKPFGLKHSVLVNLRYARVVRKVPTERSDIARGPVGIGCRKS